MATYIFADIDAFKGHVGKAISVSFDLAATAPHILGAWENYLEPWIGDTLWQQMLTAVESNTFTTQETALLPYLQRPLALLTMYDYLATGEIIVSDQGVYRQETDQQKTAYKNQINNYRGYMLQTGYQALEGLLKFLEANNGDYSNWTSNAASKRTREAFINYATSFQVVYSRKINRYTMETLRGLMLDIEEFAIRPNLGDNFYNELKAAIDARTVTDNQQQVITIIQSAVANFTIEEGMRRMLVQNTGIAIVTIEALEPQSNYRQGKPAGTDLSLSLRHHDEFANRHMSRLKQFLTTNIDNYPTYKTYIEALEGAEEEEEEEDNNERNEQTYGCNKTTKKKRTNIVTW